MIHKAHSFYSNRRFWKPAVAAVALPVFLMGLVVSTGFNWTGAAEAERPGTTPWKS